MGSGLGPVGVYGMGKGVWAMTVLEDVTTLIETLAPNGIYDDCIATRLQLSVR